MWREQAVTEWSLRVIPIVACCYGGCNRSHCEMSFLNPRLFLYVRPLLHQLVVCATADLRNVIVSGYVTFCQNNEFFVYSYMFFFIINKRPSRARQNDVAHHRPWFGDPCFYVIPVILR